MKSLPALLCALLGSLVLSACGTRSIDITIRIPAGSTADYVFSDEEVCSRTGSITLLAGAGTGDTEVLLVPLQALPDYSAEPQYLTHGMPLTLPVPKGAWFKVGIAAQNDSHEDKSAVITVRGATVRIP